MYHENGDFGQVRLASLVPTLQSEGLFSLHSVGWHKCNDHYQISHPDGNDDHLILITTGGCGFMEIEGLPYELPAGTIAFIPRNVANRYGTPKGGPVNKKSVSSFLFLRFFKISKTLSFIGIFLIDLLDFGLSISI